jgi:hypothetical protein
VGGKCRSTRCSILLLRFELKMVLSSDIWMTRYDALFDPPC